MAVLEEKRLLQELSKGKLHSIYVLVGEETGKIDFYTRAIEKAVLSDAKNSFNFESHYTDAVKALPLLDSLSNVSLWQGRKLVVLKRLEKWPAKELEQFLSVLEMDLGETVLLICADKIDGRGKFAQALGKSKDTVALVRCEPLREADWSQWLHALSAKRNLRLSPQAKELLLRVGFTSVLDLDQTLSKIELFAATDGTVELEQLNQVQLLGRPESVFAFTDAILAKQTKQALDILTQLEQQGEEPLQLLALVARQFRSMQQILALQQAGKSEAAITSELRLFPRQAKTLWSAISRRSSRELYAGLVRVAVADQTLKSTREPPYSVLQRLSLDLTGNQRRN